MHHRSRSLGLALSMAVTAMGCDDPVDGPIGALILVIETDPWEGQRGGPHVAVGDISSIALHTTEIEAIVDGRHVTLDTAERTVEILAPASEVLVAQYQVPVGTLEQIRVFVTSVDVRLLTGETVELEPDTANLASWGQTGWKLSLDTPIVIEEDVLSGMRVDFDFDREVLFNNGQGYKLQPNAPAVEFQVNPDEGRPGVFADQVTVWFDESTTEADVDRINAEIDATVLFRPQSSQVWRMKLPASINLEQAADYYIAQPEVDALLPAINYDLLGSFAVSGDTTMVGIETEMRAVNADVVWEHRARFNDVASQEIVVAVMDCGIDLRSDEFKDRIHINSAEIPPDILERVDLNEDGKVTWAELNDPQNFDNSLPCSDQSGQPKADAGVVDRPGGPNGDVCNGRIDAHDLGSAESPWITLSDTDGNGFDDDIFGLNAYGIGAPLSYGCDHGTSVAGIIAAHPANGVAGAGIAHGVTLLPIRVGDQHHANDTAIEEALRYVQKVEPDVVVMSLGLTVINADSNTPCTGQFGGFSELTKVPTAEYNRRIADHLAAIVQNTTSDPEHNRNLVVEQMANGGSTLYVGAAGNTRVDVSDQADGSTGVYIGPAGVIHGALPAQTLLVGATNRSGSRRAVYSNYGNAVEVYAPGDWNYLLGEHHIAADTSEAFGGTSYAAPVVAAHAALIHTDEPNSTAADVKDRILEVSRFVEVETSCVGSGTVYGPIDEAFVNVAGHL